MRWRSRKQNWDAKPIGKVSDVVLNEEGLKFRIAWTDDTAWKWANKLYAGISYSVGFYEEGRQERMFRWLKYARYAKYIPVMVDLIEEIIDALKDKHITMDEMSDIVARAEAVLFMIGVKNVKKG